MQNPTASSAFSFFTELVDRLYALPSAKKFRQPVFDLWTDEALPGYRDTIATPMDLGTVKRRLKEGYYSVVHESQWKLDENSVMGDIELTFRNCMEYNTEGSDVYLQAQTLLHFAKATFKERDLQLQRDEAERKLIEERRAAKSAERKRLRLEQQRDLEMRQKIKATEKVKKEDVYLKRQKFACTKASPSSRVVTRASAKAARHAVSPVKFEQGRLENNQSLHTPNGTIREEKHSVRHIRSVPESGEILITFVSLNGLRRKCGKKSAIARQLEEKHIQLMFQRRRIVEFKIELARRTEMLMTEREKEELCEKIANLNFRQLLSVLRLLASGLNRPELLNANEVDIPVENIDNRTLREIQMSLEQPVVSRIQDSLETIENVLKDIEVEYVKVRYQAVE